VRCARLDASGSPVIPHNGDSALGALQEPEDLLTHEQHVYAYAFDDEDMLVSVFTAAVTGSTEGSPGRLLLGPVTELLGAEPPAPGRFQPTDEGLALDEEDDEDGEGHRGFGAAN